MRPARVWRCSPLVLVALGVVLFLVAVQHHVSEFIALKGGAGPLVALTLDGLPALGLVYGGYWAFRADLTPASQRKIVGWALGGSLLFLTVIGATLLVRMVEGRTIAEPIFPLLIAVESGALAGLAVGYYSDRAQREARRANHVSSGLAFVNKLIRHDLRNDLNVIQGHAELIATDAEATEGSPTQGDPSLIVTKSEEALRRIETTRAVANTLVRDHELEPIDLTVVVADVVENLEETHGVCVQADVPDHAWAEANAGVRSVVDNLLENAIEHNDTEEPHVTLTLRTEGDTVVLAVGDNGPGVPASERESLFAPTETAAGGGGLSLVRDLLEGYGGAIRVEDSEMGGARFVVELPRANRE